MKHLIQLVVTIVFVSTLLGCTEYHGKPMSVSTNVHPAGTPSMDYMYRSPPTAAAAQLAAPH
jgi:hypothetical protein